MSDGRDWSRSMVNRVLRANGVGHLIAALDLPPADGQVYDELVDRMNSGVATRRDLDQLAGIQNALKQGAKRIPVDCRVLGPRRVLDVAPVNQERLMEKGIPPLIIERIADQKLFDTAAISRVKRFDQERDHLLVLIGDKGCGKSFAAAWWVAHGDHRAPPIMRGRVGPVRFVECDLLTDMTRDERGALSSALALALDDVGTERDTAIDDVAVMLVRRYRSALRTIVTTNLNQKDFERRYGGRVADRMKESGQYATVGLESLRGKDRL